MWNNPPRRRTWRRKLGTIALLAFIVAAAMVTYGVAQQHNNLGSSPSPLQPVQAQTNAGSNPSLSQQATGVVDSLKKGANDAAATIESEYGKARDALQSMGIQARVYSRLHWDKDLADASLTIDSPSAGVVSIAGSLPNAAAKTKAIKLAEDTIGVTKVLDQLNAPVTSPAISPATATSAPTVP